MFFSFGYSPWNENIASIIVSGMLIATFFIQLIYLCGDYIFKIIFSDIFI